MPRTYTKISAEDRKKGEYYEYKREKERIHKKLLYYNEKFEKEIMNINVKYARKARKAYFDVCNDAIGEWYEAYIPNLYRRKKSLYQLPSFEIDASDKRNIVATFDDEDPNRITRYHRVSQEYIYINSYLRGWHGGADMLGDNPAPGFEAPHPAPRTGPFGIGNESGIPYWRWPAKPKNGFNRWEVWYPSPAIRTESPEMIIRRNWPPVQEQLEAEHREECRAVFVKYRDKFREYKENIMKNKKVVN